LVLGGSEGFEPSPYAVTARRSAVKLRPTENISDFGFRISDFILDGGLSGNSGLAKREITFTKSQIRNSEIRNVFLAGTTRLELANQLIEGQPAFHFAFIPKENFGFRLGETLCEELRSSYLSEIVFTKSEIRIPKSEMFSGSGGGIRTHTV
jgi:hypothetical protein